MHNMILLWRVTEDEEFRGDEECGNEDKKGEDEDYNDYNNNEVEGYEEDTEGKKYKNKKIY